MTGAEPKRWWQHAWAIFGAVIGIIGAVTGIISVVPLLFRDASDAESLTVSVAPADSELAPVFAIPVTTDWSSFPEADAACSSEQLAWLASVGAPLPQRYLVSVGNTAKEGATISLKEFRGEGSASPTPPTSVAVVCDSTGSGGSAMRAAQLDPASGRAAVYVQADESLPDNPLVFNLAPGESGEFALVLQSSADFDGDVVFTAALGAETWKVALPTEHELSLPGVVDQQLIVTQTGLACLGDAECDAAQIITDALDASGTL